MPHRYHHNLTTLGAHRLRQHPAPAAPHQRAQAAAPRRTQRTEPVSPQDPNSPRSNVSEPSASPHNADLYESPNSRRAPATWVAQNALAAQSVASVRLAEIAEAQHKVTKLEMYSAKCGRQAVEALTIGCTAGAAAIGTLFLVPVPALGQLAAVVIGAFSILKLISAGVWGIRKLMTNRTISEAKAELEKARAAFMVEQNVQQRQAVERTINEAPVSTLRLPHLNS